MSVPDKITTDDLVADLRAWCQDLHGAAIDGCVMCVAADEIERLRGALSGLRLVAEQLDRLATDAENPEMVVAYIMPREPVPYTAEGRVEWRAEWQTGVQRYRARLDGHIIIYLREWARRITEAVAAAVPSTDRTEEP